MKNASITGKTPESDNFETGSSWAGGAWDRNAGTANAVAPKGAGVTVAGCGLAAAFGALAILATLAFSALGLALALGPIDSFAVGMVGVPTLLGVGCILVMARALRTMQAPRLVGFSLLVAALVPGAFVAWLVLVLSGVSR